MTRIWLPIILVALLAGACATGGATVIPDQATATAGTVNDPDRLVLRFSADGAEAKTLLVKPDGTITWQPGDTDATPNGVSVWVEHNGVVLPYQGSRTSSDLADNQAFVIGPGDVLDINVWKNPELSRQVPVRPDGRITMPLVGDVAAAGLSPEELKTYLQEALKRFVSSPEVTVIVAEVHSYQVFLQGMVANPGTYPFAGRITLVQAISLAGGLNEFADRSGIIIMRPVAGGTKRIVVNYNAILNGNRPDEPLRPGDSIIVP